MSARDELIEIVTRDPISSGGDEIWATDLVDAFAHELAEKIRAKCRELYGSPNALRPGRWADEGYGLLDAADLIDPEVTS